jgi:hypothetical protein
MRGTVPLADDLRTDDIRREVVFIANKRFVRAVNQRERGVRAYIDDVFNGHSPQSLDKYTTENLVSHCDQSLHGQKALAARPPQLPGEELP